MPADTVFVYLDDDPTGEGRRRQVDPWTGPPPGWAALPAPSEQPAPAEADGAAQSPESEPR